MSCAWKFGVRLIDLVWYHLASSFIRQVLFIFLGGLRFDSAPICPVSFDLTLRGGRPLDWAGLNEMKTIVRCAVSETQREFSSGLAWLTSGVRKWWVWCGMLGCVDIGNENNDDGSSHAHSGSRLTGVMISWKNDNQLLCSGAFDTFTRFAKLFPVWFLRRASWRKRIDLSEFCGSAGFEVVLI